MNTFLGDDHQDAGGSRGFLLPGLFPLTPSSPCKDSTTGFEANLHKTGSKISLTEIQHRPKQFSYFVPGLQAEVMIGKKSSVF